MQFYLDTINASAANAFKVEILDDNGNVVKEEHVSKTGKQYEIFNYSLEVNHTGIFKIRFTNENTSKNNRFVIYDVFWSGPAN